MSTLSQANASLAELAQQHEACLLFYSGGKESLVVADLAHRHFRRVVGVFMYLVPGLAIQQRRLDYARQRWGLECILWPHWLLSRFLKNGTYCVPVPDLKEMGLSATHALARHQTGLELLLTGHRKGDGAHTRPIKKSGAVMPVYDWSKLDVLAYLKREKIDAPEAVDMDLSYYTLLYLYDHHPEDFARLCEMFPFAGAVVKRREWFGVGGKRKLS